MRRIALPACLLLSSCFLFEPAGPPPQQPAPLASSPGEPGAWTEVIGDTDGDRIPDDRDRCPDQPEDKDGFEDEDGCPDPDNDKDGIPDRCDRCPNEPEVFNDIEDTDGCPDRALVRVGPAHIQIVQNVQFARGQTRPSQESKPVLDALAQVLNEHPELEMVACLGHASDDEAQPETLGMRRAQEVREQLMQRGIDGNRLVPFSAGNRRPLDPRPVAVARERNRRTELQLLTVRGEELRRWNGTHFEELPSSTPPRPVTPAAPAAPGCP